MGKRKYIIVVEWEDIFGESHEEEIPCTNAKKLEDQIVQLRYRFRYDQMVSTFKIYSIVR